MVWVWLWCVLHPTLLPGLEVRAGLTLLNLLTTPRHIQLYKRVVLSGSTVVDYREAWCHVEGLILEGKLVAWLLIAVWAWLPIHLRVIGSRALSRFIDFLEDIYVLVFGCCSYFEVRMVNAFCLSGWFCYDRSDSLHWVLGLAFDGDVIWMLDVGGRAYVTCLIQFLLSTFVLCLSGHMWHVAWFLVLARYILSCAFLMPTICFGPTRVF